MWRALVWVEVFVEAIVDGDEKRRSFRFEPLQVESALKRLRLRSRLD